MYRVSPAQAAFHKDGTTSGGGGILEGKGWGVDALQLIRLPTHESYCCASKDSAVSD